MPAGRLGPAVCNANLHVLGQGLHLYANNNEDRLPPGRMPKVDDQHWQIEIAGGLKYRPTFLAIMGAEIGVQAFADPMPVKGEIDREGSKVIGRTTPRVFTFVRA